METEKRTGPIAWMAGNSVAANLLMFFFIIGGLLMMGQLKQEVFPDTQLDEVTVSVPYPGASPEEVEKSVIMAVEGEVRGLEGVTDVRSTAREGSGTVVIELQKGGNLDRLASDVKNAVDRITTFPDEAEEPTVAPSSFNREVAELVIYGDQDARVLREYAEQMRDRLLQNRAITQVNMRSTRDLEILVDVSQEKLRRYGITLQDLADKIRMSALDLPAGSLKTSAGEIMIRVEERRDIAEEFASLPVLTTENGGTVLLRDIASVTDGFEDSDRYSYFNGMPAERIQIMRVGEQTPIEVSDAVQKEIAAMSGEMPEGVDVALRNDRSKIFRQRLDLLLRNAAMGLALVLVLLGIFLEARLAFWVTMGIPISFLGTFIFLKITGISLNIISMFGFIVALGIVVDDAIVVGENIFKFREEGHSFAESAYLGAKEVAEPVVFSILTNVAAFMPLFFIDGRMGKFIFAVPVVVISAFLISLIESLFVLPAHLAHGGEKGPRGIFKNLHNWQQKFSDAFMRLVAKVYGPILGFCLRWRYLTIAAGIAIMMIIIAYVKGGHIRVINFPKTDSDYAYAEVNFAEGTPLARMNEIRNKLEKKAGEVVENLGGDKLSEGIVTEINGSTLNTRIFLVDADIRPHSTPVVTKAWREAVGPIYGVENYKMQSDKGGPGSHGAALTVELSHRNIATLEKAAAELAEQLRDVPNTLDIDDGFANGKRQFGFTMRPEAESLGLTAGAIGRQLRNAFYGAEALKQQRGRNEITVRVQLPESESSSEADISNFLIATPAGTRVPLRDLVNFEKGRAYTVIKRREARRIMEVTSDVAPYNQLSVVQEAVNSELLPKLKAKYPGLVAGFEGRQADMRDSMTSLITGMIASLFVIYGLLAIPFRSYLQPLVVMIGVPFGFGGAILGHILMGYHLSIMSMYGILALSGLVINDSLVLVDFANRRRALGESPIEAIRAAGVLRFRPIMLTTLSTFFGLMPIIFETSRQAIILIPMAIALGFGILFSTVVILLIVPSLYLWIEDVKDFFSRLYGDSDTV